MAIVRGHVAYLLDQVRGKTLEEAREVLEIGVITVLPEEIRWQSDIPPGHEKSIPIPKVVTVEEAPRRIDAQRTQPCVILHTVEHTHTFVCGENSDISSEELVRAIRQAMDMQFISTDEITYGTRPRRFRGTVGPHVVLAVSDLSWGEEAEKTPIKVEVSTLNAPFSWKRRLFLAKDVYNHLQQGFNDLIAQAILGTEIAERCRDLGALLLHNTISARAISELSKLVPSLVTLRVDDLLVHFPWGIIHDGKHHVLLDYAVAQQISTIGTMDLRRETATFRRRQMLILSNPTLDLPGT